MPINTIDPSTNKLVKRFKAETSVGLEKKLKLAHRSASEWKLSSMVKRAHLLKKLSAQLWADKEKLANLMTLEMGKPKLQAIAEVEKCAATCLFYAENATEFLKPEQIKTEARKSFVQNDPLGVILAIMPWNFPFWQVIRFAAPASMAGNTCLLKHASNVPQCALAIEKLFKKAGYPKGIFQTLLIGSSKIKGLIADKRVAAVTLTGSELAGSEVASLAGKYIKKAVLELGGSDPFIVLKDADLKKAATVAIKSRMSNAGQSCIAAKRFIVEKPVVKAFTEMIVELAGKLEVGDPRLKETQVGPLAREDLVKELASQVSRSVKKGAKVLLGGKRPGSQGAYYLPTVLGNVKKGMPAYDEEIFGPVASIIEVSSAAEAVLVANDTDYGLGASIWTKNRKKAQQLATQIESGSVFINSLMRSDPRLPFGGIKRSGYGRELSKQGILEFVNQKTVWVD